MLSSTNNNNNSIKKNIEKKKSYATTVGLNPNVGNNQVVPEKEKICSGPIHVPLGKGTVLTCAQNLIAFERYEATNIVRIQMQSHVESHTALEIIFSNEKECFFFVDYLKIWNCRDTINTIRKCSSTESKEDWIEIYYKTDMDNIITFSFDSQKKVDDFYVLAKAFRDNYQRGEGKQNYDRFYFSIYEGDSGAALYGTNNDFNFSFSSEVKFELVCNVEPLWPNNDLN